MPKRNKTQEHLEATVMFKHGGKIDLKKLWAKDSEVEADPQKINNLINASKIRPANKS
jgi:hypothetical protein